jgi:hypothetical protein
MLLGTAFAQEPPVVATEASVKAAFLYKFTGYIDWPPQALARPDTPIVIGVANGRAVEDALDTLAAGRSVAGHPIVVRHLRSGDSPRGVHLLFVGGEEPDRALIAAAEKGGALVVTEGAQGLEAGSAINFVVSNGHVGFEVSLDAAERSGLRISARMLGVARRVVQKGA